jgi:hypothetical protein
MSVTTLTCIQEVAGSNTGYVTAYASSASSTGKVSMLIFSIVLQSHYTIHKQLKPYS